MKTPDTVSPGSFLLVKEVLLRLSCKGPVSDALEVGRCNGFPLAVPNEKAGVIPGLFVYPTFLIASSKVWVVQTVSTLITS